jgi:hypothetical protein
VLLIWLLDSLADRAPVDLLPPRYQQAISNWVQGSKMELREC